MAYEWQPRECNPSVTNEKFPRGVPYSKLPRVTLEKDGELKKFLTQEEVDAAWADGWHEPGRPETAEEKPEIPTYAKSNPNLMKVACYMDRELWQWVKRHADQHKIPVSHVMNSAVAKYREASK